ncbi:hypothetical protein H6781_01240 [Candidatus Nomurabacteria bacterium]|nr:hypothetical protein [Candidatus Nomurabacteria bacterium]MCB9818146.1 hypothetical protein [Candidatus Nomurabacteria bacterium]
MLFASFLVQPVHKAYANEVDTLVPDEEEEVVPESVSVQSTEVEATEDEDVSEIELDQSDDENPEPSVVEGQTQNEDAGENDPSEAIVNTEPQASSTQVISSENTSSGTSSTSTPSSSNTSTTETSTSTNESEVVEVATSTTSSGTSSSGNSESSTTTSSDEADETTSTSGDEDEEEQVSSDDSDTSTTTEDFIDEDVEEEVGTSVIEAQTLNTEDNFYQFNRQSCVAIGDGTYHCTVNAQPGIDSNAVVYAELGENSNMEIFLKTSKGEVKQLTDNSFDDTSPSYDAETLQIVWQRLVDDRYQIVLYDIEEGEEKQLTFSRTNNMEPKVSEAGIVWQAWDGHDWEIMYFDGQYTDQLTDNLTQDVAPAIDDGYILWSVLGNSEQEAKVYSIASGETLNINGYEGGVIANPRFVLVYDTMFDNGDVITQGFDPTTGLSAPIAARPAEDPVDIPDTDSTGETRALIQNKSSQKDEYDPDNLNNDTGSSTPNGTSGTASSTDLVPETLDLKQISDSATSTETDISTSTESTADPVFELTDYDLILTPTSTVEASESASSTEQ